MEHSRRIGHQLQFANPLKPCSFVIRILFGECLVAGKRAESSEARRHGWKQGNKKVLTSLALSSLPSPLSPAHQLTSSMKNYPCEIFFPPSFIKSDLRLRK